MEAASLISQSIGMLGSSDAARQRALLQALDLPVSCEVEPAALAPALTLDKKNRAGRINWIMLACIGQAEIRSDIPAEAVERAIQRVCGSE
jgi:3-dehydroquinate synthetase